MPSTVYEIDTPENVVFRVERAGLASRALAWALDMLAMACFFQIGALVLAPFQPLLGEAVTAVLLVAAFLLQWWYGALSEWRFRGRTLGKWLVGIATRDQAGLRLTLTQTVIRNLLRVVDLLPGLYLCGAVASLCEMHGRRLGDLAAGTLVIRERRPGLPARILSRARADAALHPEILELGSRVTAAERGAILALCGQRDELPLAVRAELFEQLCSHLEARFQVRRAEHLTAEKFVLYVAAGLAKADVMIQES